MKIKASFILPIALALSAPTWATSYLCVTEQSGGVTFTDGSWQSTTFKAGKKYIIRESQSSASTWEVVEMGEEHPRYTCEDDFHEAGFLNCDALSQEFQFNKNNGRFMLSSFFMSYPFEGLEIGGEIPLGDEMLDSGWVSIGKCSRF